MSFESLITITWRIGQGTKHDSPLSMIELQAWTLCIFLSYHGSLCQVIWHNLRKHALVFSRCHSLHIILTFEYFVTYGPDSLFLQWIAKPFSCFLWKFWHIFGNLVIFSFQATSPLGDCVELGFFFLCYMTRQCLHSWSFTFLWENSQANFELLLELSE